MTIKRWKLGLKRCNCVQCESAITFEQTEENCGWVMWEHHKDEVTRLKAEVERLTLASQGAVKYVDHTMALTRQSMEHHKQVSRLEAQVERLTKAGNAMAEIFKNQMDNEPECVGYLQEQLFNRWNAAKEGKQP